jgi:hypothetical protein
VFTANHDGGDSKLMQFALHRIADHVSKGLGESPWPTRDPGWQQRGGQRGRLPTLVGEEPDALLSGWAGPRIYGWADQHDWTEQLGSVNSQIHNYLAAGRIRQQKRSTAAGDPEPVS